MLEGDESGDSTKYHFNGYSLDLRKRCMYGPDGNSIALGSRSFDTLQLLVAHRGETLSKAFLMENVWPGIYVDENNLNQAITGIRKALGDSKNTSRFIKTVIGRGYCFVAELDEPEQVARPQLPIKSSNDALVDFSHDFVLPHKAGFGDSTPTRFHHPAVYIISLLLVSGIIGTGLFFNANRPKQRVALVADSTWQPSAPTAAMQQRAKISDSIAILPLKNLNSAQEKYNELFVSGLHDELINQLSNLTNLNLVSRKSVLVPRVQELSIPEIGELLRVESIVTGTVLFFETKARINVQMLDSATGMIKWTFVQDVDTKNFKDLLHTQREIALSVKEALRNDLGLNAAPVGADWSTESFEAYRYNMAAERAFINQDFAKSLTLSKQALVFDPNFLDALYNFSRANYFLISRPMKGMITSDHLKQGLESAERLIELAPDQPKGYVLKAVGLADSGRWNDAMDEVQRLQQMNVAPSDLQLLSPLLMSLGQYRTTINILEANLQAEPLNSYGRGFLMAAYEATGNSILAKLEYETGEELTPAWWGDTVDIFLTLGRGEPFAHVERVKSEDLRSVLAMLNDGDRAGVLSKLNRGLTGQFPTSSIFVHYAAIAAAIGEDELAINLMIRATDILPIHLHWIWLPVFTETRHHPYFRHLLEHVGVLAYWEQYGPPEICESSPDYLVCNMHTAGNELK